MPRLLAILLLCLAYWAAPAVALTLSQAERIWLAAHPTLRLGVDASWPPFEFRDEQGRYQGLTADYIALVEQRLGVSIQLVEPSSWSVVLEQAKAGHLDLLPGVMATPERQTSLAFTRPYLDFPIVILARNGGPQPRTLNDLYGLKVAVVENYPLADWLTPGFWLRTLHPDDRQHAFAYCKSESAAGRSHSLDYRMYAADGRIVWIHDIVTLIQHSDNAVLRGLMIDVTETKQTEQALRLSEQKFASVFQQCPDMLVIARRSDGCLLEVNSSFEQQTGISVANALGKTATELNIWGIPGIGPDVLQRLQSGGLRNLEMPFRKHDGQLFTGLISAQPFQLDETPALVVVVRDISQLKETQQRLQTSEEKFAKVFHSSPDGLLLTRMSDGLLLEVNEGFTRLSGYSSSEIADRSTLDLGLWDNQEDRQRIMQLLSIHGVVRDFTAPMRNRSGELRLCELSTQIMQISGERCLLTIAHDVTERLQIQEKLQQAATVFESTAEGVMITDTRQRIPGLQHASDAEQIANKLLSGLSAPFQADEHEFFISASIGVSLFPQDGNDVATLVKNADAAMYRSKAKGRNRSELYTRDLTFQATERMALEHELRRALERGELSLYYQPKLSLSSQLLVGAEALIRWHHPVLGEILPERFIPLAEDNGLILPLGDWVLQEACRQMGEWQKQHSSFGPMSVNLAGAQLRQPQLVERIDRLLKSYNLEPALLQLEITENFIMSQAEEALAILHELKRLGVQLAIDDFGTGYSSLSYLKRLPLNTLKIDQSFVRGLPDDPHDAAITRAIIALGRSMQLTVIAEGVETKAQELFLASEGCEEIQGFIVSRPLPAELFASNFLNPYRLVGAPQKAPV